MENNRNRPILRFLQDEQAAVTVDFVFLSGAVILLAMACVSILLSGSIGIGATVEGSLDQAEVAPVIIP